MKLRAVPIFILLFALAVPLVALALEPYPLSYSFAVMGTPTDNTFKATLTNASQSLKTLAEAAGITWTRNGQPPHGALITVEDNNAKFGAFLVSVDNVGHDLTSGSSLRTTGAGWVDALRLCNATDNSNTVVQVTLER